uniref:Uncharacterized protein n=1 Tax=Alexandrium catenella TaxID=2925 RepID=A0A7S1LSH5_ALECA|mmetsp:Transcript_11851/g.32395  ORF Transcript_11851/g.32395 Transcript_11851/m.32395 type:complete len:445 (+) Transcript_11851:53-1387(+)|eukprot:CAMPEP_0171209992 /NCGR_PEP_ID=MMETSP0790-20130122/28878_1 /TAXON_ID=2925 /ORGANISM="Alexandrium catenella, Strain OF101" /LENGTH=444 /DNA_ID=CAMNT_0011675613 /DNA_START=40 /DNA_END=1374 /DNA_ORIENTATION=+
MASSKGEPLLAKDEDQRPSQPRPTPVGELRDLTDELQRHGLLAEYMRFKDGYMKWRQGQARGARGEATEEGLQKERERGEALEPTDEEWNWRKTISYWIVVCTIEGSFLFLFTSIVNCKPEYWGSLKDAIYDQPVFVGGAFFGVATYLICFEVINLKKEADEHYWNPLQVCRSLRRCRELHLHKTPYMIGLLYFVGASIYQVGLAGALVPSVPGDPLLKYWIIQIPTAVGGVFFFLASIGEVVEVWGPGRNWIARWSVANDVLGCLLFAIAGFVYMMEPTPEFDKAAILMVGGTMYAVGSANFAVAAVFALMLWRDGNFGLAYSAQLAKLAPHESPGRFSISSVLWVSGLCFSGAVATMTFCCKARTSAWNMTDKLDYVTRTFYPLLMFVIIHMVIALRAAVVNLPTEQPWKALHKACNFLLAVATLVLMAQLADCVILEWQHG